MSSAEQNFRNDDEPTIACRYLLYTELPSGSIAVRRPACDESATIDEVPQRVVLVKRPLTPGGAES